MVVQDQAKNIKTQLDRIQRTSCQAITVATKSTLITAMKVLLNLTPLDRLVMAEARVVLYRLHKLKQPAVPHAETGLLCVLKDVSDPILDMRSDHTVPVYRHSRSFQVIIHWDYPTHPEDSLVWFTDGSKADSGTGSGIFGVRPN
jgi:hypothetical protein